MTYAPGTLIAARSLLVDTVPGLTGAEVGIVGDTGHAATGSSYHLGKSQLRADSYSIVESSRDRDGLTDAASALDIGEFQFGRGGKTHTLRTFSAWLVAQCEAGAADTRDIREVIYSPDGKIVKRWDRLRKRTSGDSSHTWHTHISYFRDSEQRDKAGLFRRYLTETGLLEVEVTEAELIAAVTKSLASAAGQAAIAKAAGVGVHGQRLGRSDVTFGQAIQTTLGLVSRDLVDEPAIVAGILATLTPAAIAAAIPPQLAQRVADELAARLAS